MGWPPPLPPPDFENPGVTIREPSFREYAATVICVATFVVLVMLALPWCMRAGLRVVTAYEAYTEWVFPYLMREGR